MQRNILEYLEQTAPRFPDKTAFANEQMGMTFQEVHQAARNIGTCLARKGYTKEPRKECRIPPSTNSKKILF